MKIKPLTKEQLIISIDRLTRFKEPEIKYLRVFKDIILSNLIEPKLKKSELDEIPYDKLRDYAVSVINYSLEGEIDLTINKKISDYENSVFNISDNAQILLNNKINYKAIIEILPDGLPYNLRYLKYINDKVEKLPPHPCPLPLVEGANTSELANYTIAGKVEIPYPIKKIILCEGITEEILLPEFAKILGYNLRENGIYIVSAGGKNQVVKYFYRYAEVLKIPIFVLLDNDASENKEQIIPKLRKIDKIHLVRSGEFEDLLPKTLIIKTLNYLTQNISTAPIEGLSEDISTVDFLEDFFRHRGLHEFKKADFAQAVKENISDINDLSNEIKEIINSLIG
ncbi:ATP-dependent endonuclease [bacterium]|nr:ATP-dependent endonuclease [bacterium]